MSDYVELWDRVYFDENSEAVRWERSLNKGESWKEVDCSIFPNGKPPFVKMRNDNAAWIEQRRWVPAEPIEVNAPMCDKCGKNFLECKCQQIHSVGRA